MIVGILLKNYKVYSGLKYIPVAVKHKFTAYIGDNGVGKSSILEALDTYFNSREWNITKGASTTDANTPHITLAHLLKKDIVEKIFKDDKRLDEKFLLELKKVSEKFWNFNEIESELSPSSTEAKILVNDLKKLDIDYRDTHYLLISGIGFNSGYGGYFSSFDNIISKLLFDIKVDSQKEEKNKDFRKNTEKFNYIVWSYYSYIYMPVEVSIENFTKLETENMQKLIGTDLSNEIQSIIGKSLDGINVGLNGFMRELEEKLQNSYVYKNSSGRINISMNELVQSIVNLFFSIRTLYKNIDNDKIPAKQLSSGEKRQALIEVASALIESQKMDDKEIILGIDEPEASLNVSKNFSQFERLIELSGRVQMLVTTHWYGFLPMAIKGELHCLSNDIKDKFYTFNLYNYRENLKQKIKNKEQSKNKNTEDAEIEELPSDIQLKSMYDLVQSIVSSVRLDKPYNWLICEGSSDKIYLDFYLERLIKEKNLRILPVCGASEVVKFYNYLKLPISERESIKGKIYCLIDSDGKKVANITCESGVEHNLVAKRLLNNKKSNKSNLVNMDSSDYEMPTEIEDCLDGTVFIETLKTYTEDKTIITILEDEKNLKDKSFNSYFCFNLRDDDRKTLKDFFDQDNGYRKIEFARKYVEIATKNNNSKIPEWISEIKTWFQKS